MTKAERKSMGIHIGLTGLGAFLGALIPILMAYAWIDDRFDKLELRQAVNMADRWRGRDMQTWAAQLQANNPAVTVPPVLLKD